jgi:hypothetical protein
VEYLKKGQLPDPNLSKGFPAEFLGLGISFFFGYYDGGCDRPVSVGRGALGDLVASGRLDCFRKLCQAKTAVVGITQHPRADAEPEGDNTSLVRSPAAMVAGQ